MRNFKPPTPSLAIARRGGSFSLRQRTTMTTTTSHVGSSSSSASVCTHDNDDNPPPRLQLRDGVGFFILFFKTTTPTSHVGSSSLPCVTHNDDGKPRRLVVVRLGFVWLCLHPRRRRQAT